MTKTIVIKIDNSFFIRNFFRTDIFILLHRIPDLRLVFLAPIDKIAYYQKEFPYEGIVFDALVESRFFVSERLFRFVETASIHSHTAALLHKTDFVRAKGQKSLFMRAAIYGMRRLLWHLGSFSWWRWTIRYIYWLILSKTFTAVFECWVPDLVYCPSMMYTDFRLLKEAKKQGIKTIGMILSWDNLHSKTMLRVFPDHLIVHTDNTAGEVVRYTDFPRARMFITGIPQYDRYMRRSGIISRDEFIKSIGGDPSKKLIVYAVSGKAGLHIDLGIIKIIRAEIQKNKLHNVQILLRAHPRYDFSAQKLEYIRKELGCLVEPAMTHVGTGKDNWEFDEHALFFLSNTLAHADVVIALYTTFFIEAAIFDKPLIAVGFDERDVAHEDSAKRFFEWDHLQELDALKGIWRVKSREELMDAIITYLKNPAYMHEGRQRIVARQAQFMDGKSAERVAEVIKKCL